MKLSNIAVIFIVIVLPMLLILGYYISLQIDTINMQTAYNTKLLESTKEAVEAFEINTVEWNEDYSDNSDSKRRDIMASINTFTTSLANNLGVAGTSKDYMMSRIPAIAYTLYDGYYIYSPAATKSVVKNENGVAQFMSEKLATSTYENEDGTRTEVIQGYEYQGEDDGKILYTPEAGAPSQGRYILENGEPLDFTLDMENAKSETSHMLKPFMSYSEQIHSTQNNEEAIINYTLDNYVTVYGKDNDSSSEYISKSGYLNKISNSSKADNVITISDDNFEAGSSGNFVDGSGNLIPENNPIREIYFSGQLVTPEVLTETIVYYDEEDNQYNTEEFKYVYEAEKDVKIYYDPNYNYTWKEDDYHGGFFRLDSDLRKVYLTELTEELYKKLLIPVNSSGKPSYKKIYQSLLDFKWYTQEDNGAYTLYEDGDTDHEWDDLLYEDAYFSNIIYDYSAINYCIETYYFTYWFNDQGFKYIDEHGNPTGNKIRIDDDNDPELDYSPFTMHKREIIRKLITENLKQAITNYSRTSDGQFTLPELKESEWEQVVSNISVVTFLQNIPIGLKYYNNYAIASSTTNKEYVNTRELYFYNQKNTSTQETIYHAPYCERLESGSDLIGYRSIDYLAKYYENEDEEIKYYFRHSTNEYNLANESSSPDDRPIREACYYCIVQRVLSNNYEIANAFKQPYYTTLARERYLQLEAITIEQSDVVVAKDVEQTEYDYGATLNYTITITNRGSINDNVRVLDFWNAGTMVSDASSWKFTRKKADGTEEEDNSLKAEMKKWTGDGISDDESTNDEGYAIGFDNGIGIPIAAGEQIIIEYTANLTTKVDIGEDVFNYVYVLTNNENMKLIANEEAETRIKKRVKVEPTKVAEPSNIILVLDRSTSMGINDRQGVQEAASRLVSIMREDPKIQHNINIISFAQSQSVLTDVSYYNNIPNYILSGEGISTNYLGALDKAQEILEDSNKTDPDLPTYIIFMSDGEPTNTQTAGEWETIIYTLLGKNIVTKGAVYLIHQAENLVGAVVGGWVGCIWRGENDYGYTLLISSIVSGLFDSEVVYDIPILPLAENVWAEIMEVVNELKQTAEIYTVYFNTGGKNSPIYGLQQISSGADDYYYDADTNLKLMDAFIGIARKMKGTDVSPKDENSEGTIALEKVSEITDIKIAGTSIGSTNVQTIKNRIKATSYDSATDIGTLNLNDNTLGGIFHKAGAIEIIY